MGFLDSRILIVRLLHILERFLTHIFVLAGITMLRLDWTGLNDVFFSFGRRSFYCNIHYDGHEDLFAFFAPSPNVLLFCFLIAIRTGRFTGQPPINTFPMKVVTALGNKKRISVQANRTKLLALVI